ncbi:MAG: hypothetical protein KKH44_07820 [Bacteroidetes bacterium]|nr:hypothetical protein [Bacteroidota bacterium]
MKNRYWVNEDGLEVKANYKDFRYYYDNFCGCVMDDKGNIKDKGSVSIRKVILIYNGNGIGIAGKNN